PASEEKQQYGPISNGGEKCGTFEHIHLQTRLHPSGDRIDCMGSSCECQSPFDSIGPRTWRRQLSVSRRQSCRRSSVSPQPHHWQAPRGVSELLTSLNFG